MSRLDIAIWSDVMCPWCPIGHANLQTALAQLGDGFDATVRWMPYELNPDMPPEGRPQRAHFAMKTGMSFEQTRAMRARLYEAGEAAGYPIRDRGEAQGEMMVWNTFAAHKLLRWAWDSAGAEAQGRLSAALFAAHFQDLRNVSDRDVLLDIVEKVGLDRDGATIALDDRQLEAAIRSEQATGRQRGINSVPTFVINGRYAMSGAQPPQAFVDALRQIAAQDQAA